jgi:hypothetical protein
MSLPVAGAVALAIAARSARRSSLNLPTERTTSIPFSFPRFPIRKDFKQQGRISPEIGGLVLTFVLTLPTFLPARRGKPFIL